VWAWCRLANRMGKKLIMNIGLLVALTGILGTSQLSQETSWLLLLLSMVLVYCGMAALFAVDPSLLADIVDYGTWKFGHDQTATYFAINTIATKISAAIGGALGLATAGWYGFDPAISTNSDEAIHGLYVAIAWLPSPFILIALVCITLIPINTRRHKIIRRSLEAKQARAAASSSNQPLYTSTSPQAALQVAGD
jgi:GPH family glycoside/pentoside/hexuronide:cation symporter